MGPKTQVGACPRCGAPIYAPVVWHGITPPPSEHTCGCFPPTWRVITTTGTSGYELPK